MSAIFGGARQNGYLVDDLDAALKHWVEVVGAGPFFGMRHIELEGFTYHGKPSSPDLSLAIGNVGDLQIELIQQHNDEPSPWLNFYQAKGAGLHHVSAWTADYDAEIQRLRDRDIVPTAEGTIASSSCRFAYFNADATDGSAFEISDLGRDNEHGALHDMVREAAIGWDGSEPVRFL